MEGQNLKYNIHRQGGKALIFLAIYFEAVMGAN